MTRPRRALLIASTALISAAVGVGSAFAGSPTKRVEFTEHWSSPPDKSNTLPPCNPVTFKSPTGVCRGTATGHATNTGSWKGHADFQYGWLYPSSRITYIQGIETFTGRVVGCGEGTLTYRLSVTVSPTGKLTGKISVIPALGTGALKGSSGNGTYSGTVNPDFSNTGTARGTLTCQS